MTIQTWPKDTFDAVSVIAKNCQCKIIGVDIEQVSLETKSGPLHPDGIVFEVTQGWLQIQILDEEEHDSAFTLQLPKSKVWVVNLSTWWSKAEINNLQLRTYARVVEGDLDLCDCRGKFSISCTKGKFHLERCSEQSVPDQPILNDLPPVIPPFPGSAEFRGPWHGERGEAWDWYNMSPEDWSEWGTHFGKEARTWALQFSQMFSPMTRADPNAGLQLHISKAEAEIKQITMYSCSIVLSKGVLKLEGGQIRDLAINGSHSNLECRSVLPSGLWNIKTNRGDIKIALPSDTQARIDAAARRGDIHANIPMVRVPRPGPESETTTRMVGTTGPSQADNAQLNLSTIHGNIEIELQKSPAVIYIPLSKQAEEKAPASSTPGEAVSPEVSSPAPVPAESSPEQSGQPGEQQAETKYDSQLAVLQSLSEGIISVAEAEVMLKTL
jgi:hypothetical protein